MSQIFKESTHKLIDIVFEAIRNTLACASIFVAALYLFRHPEYSMFGASLAQPLAIIIAFGASALVLLSLICAASKATPWLKIASKGHILLFVVAFVIFMVTTLSCFGGIVKLGSQQFDRKPLNAEVQPPKPSAP